MSNTEIKKRARQVLKGYWGKAISLTFILGLLVILLPAVVVAVVEIYLSGGFEAWFNTDSTPLASDVFSTILSILTTPLTIASLWFYLSISRKETPSLSNVFGIYRDGRTSFKTIIACYWMFLLTILWSLLLIVPGIIKSFSYSQTYFILKDHPSYTVNEAITESRKMMDGLKNQYFTLCLSFIGWGILSLLTLGIGFLWLVPYIQTCLAVFYSEAAAKQNNSTTETITP
ncbi:DUF975 family protein [Domibacillus sp. DTU_2020_1001157_1_SI_ALB_TIR_016]|uniref:DUF975 family protein n=1 Tax=Domibacillus sp. DTU_2020_1001157_1_SI_ALB_TIR_016 TaxID=3077789 RepID=UPI0028EC1520|nr:DUF975 family protein [Domibacillus sp. DTU_2020_1001157_1_SI_ALB_TIR_016]WNS79544.1 DUF975 family protein [Domibacillus sp. DTU_2020_1001157_1_SI_ALB_TIR_016]